MNAPLDIKSYMLEVGRRARAASREVARADTDAKNRALIAAANFEGEDVESRLARRTRNWIADVRIADGRNLTTPALRATPP